MGILGKLLITYIANDKLLTTIMKKILLFAGISACSLLLGSCSNDDNNSTDNSSSTGSTGKVTFKINGVAKTLNTTSVALRTPEADGDVYLWAAATDGKKANFDFQIYRGRVGNQGYANFYVDENFYATASSDFVIYFTQNDEHHLKGTFSGEIINYAATGSNSSAQVTEGSFDINY